MCSARLFGSAKPCRSMANKPWALPKPTRGFIPLTPFKNSPNPLTFEGAPSPVGRSNRRGSTMPRGCTSCACVNSLNSPSLRYRYTQSDLPLTLPQHSSSTTTQKKRSPFKGSSFIQRRKR